MEALRHKVNRVSIRLSDSQKSKIDQAAQILGMSVSSFVLSNALEAADRIEHHIELSERDWNRFLEIIESDTEPTLAALNAAERYRKGNQRARSGG